MFEWVGAGHNFSRIEGHVCVYFFLNSIGDGVIIPNSRAFAIASSRACTPNLTYAPDSRLRTVELETPNFLASSSVDEFGYAA